MNIKLGVCVGWGWGGGCGGGVSVCGMCGVGCVVCELGCVCGGVCVR